MKSVLKSKKEFIFLILLVIFSFITRFYHLSYPNKVVFDETHFALYATKYLSGEYYFDIHPPLGKMLYALVAFLSGQKPSVFDFKSNSPYQDFNYLYLRGFNALFGCAFLVLIYLLIKEMGFSYKTGLWACFFLLLENSLILESRFILLNNFLLFFIFLSFYFFFKGEKQKIFTPKWYFFNFLTGIGLGLATSIKILGAGVIFLLFFYNLIIKEELAEQKKKEIKSRIIFYLGLPLLVFLIIFLIHFWLLPYLCFENCGYILKKCQNLNLEDCQKNETTTYSSFNQPFNENFFVNFGFTLITMLINTFVGPTNFLYNPTCLSFSLNLFGFSYFQEKIDSKISLFYFVGNPLIYYLSFLAVFFFFVVFIFKLFLKKDIVVLDRRIFFLISGYFIFYGSLFKSERFLLPYLYFPALVCAILLLAIFLTEILAKIKNKKIYWGIISVLVVLTVFSFIFYAPFTYGLPLEEEEIKTRLKPVNVGFIILERELESLEKEF